MAKQVLKTPNYHKIYSDIIKKRFPDKSKDCEKILNKSVLNTIDVIALNQKIFTERKTKSENFNKKYRSYDISSILKILEFQKKNNYNNSQLAVYFSISRNSVTKWKKIYANRF